jgi:hypothetical protein
MLACLTRCAPFCHVLAHCRKDPWAAVASVEKLLQQAQQQQQLEQ